MNTVFLRVGFILLVLCVGADMQCQAQSPKEVATARREIEAASRRSDTAAHQKDIKLLMRFYADDFQGQDIGGKVYNKKQAEQNITKIFAVAKTVKSHSDIKDLKLNNGKATTVTHEYTTLDVVSKDGKMHTVVFDGQESSVLVKRNGVWQIWREKHLTQTVTRDDGIVSKKP